MSLASLCVHGKRWNFYATNFFCEMSAQSGHSGIFGHSEERRLIDILKGGLGNLVDADLADESAKLQSLPDQAAARFAIVGDGQLRPAEHTGAV
jgi:hypothetical protein